MKKLSITGCVFGLGEDVDLVIPSNQSGHLELGVSVLWLLIRSSLLRHRCARQLKRLI